MAYLVTCLERLHTRQRHSWQRTRRIGRSGFVLLGILYFWLTQLAAFFLGKWLLLHSSNKALTLPHHAWEEILAMILFGTIGIYFTGAYAWRRNERNYGNPGQE